MSCRRKKGKKWLFKNKIKQISNPLWKCIKISFCSSTDFSRCWSPQGEIWSQHSRAASTELGRTTAISSCEIRQQQAGGTQPGATSPEEGAPLMGDVCLALFKIPSAVSNLLGMRHLTFLSLKRKPVSLLKITEDGKGKIYFLDFFLSQRKSCY